MSKKLTTKEFIRRAKEVHGDKYDYSKVDYIDNHTKVCIICPEHGEFWQEPKNHLLGQTCPKCAYKTRWESRGRITTEIFIKKARKVHGNKYDYSKVKYKGTHTKVCIICLEHGEFLQTPHNHIEGSGCPKCGGRKQLTTKEFIEKAKEIHGNKYDYSKVDYVDKRTKVCIICPEHGEFWQVPTNHLSGHGCPKCVGRNKTTKDFIQEACKVHGNKYNYSKVKYTNACTKVCIICPEHGEFWQTPNSHLYGKGCPNCKGLTKQYKFNLLEEFESELEFKAFLMNNHVDIIYVILRNIERIEPKFEPIKRDLERVLGKSNKIDPIKALKDKYTSGSDEDELEEEFNADMTPNIDLDDDNVIDTMVSAEKHTPTIDEVIKNTKKEIKVINKIEHLLTPEDREYIMCKFLNDKRRMWMYARENSVK